MCTSVLHDFHIVTGFSYMQQYSQAVLHPIRLPWNSNPHTFSLTEIVYFEKNLTELPVW